MVERSLKFLLLQRSSPTTSTTPYNHGVQPDGVEEEVRRAHGAVPAQCTHAGTAPPHAAPGHTQKAAQQAAVTHALGCASRWLKQPHVTVVITVDSPTTLHDLQSEAAPRGRQRQQPPAAAAAAEQHAHRGREESSGKRRRKAPPQSGNKRTRTDADEDGDVDEAGCGRTKTSCAAYAANTARDFGCAGARA